MENLIYYPGFMPNDSLWLKYALLYLDNFSSIVPRSRRPLISDFHRKVLDETDLVSHHHPDFGEGNQASIKAIQEVEKILQNPILYNDILSTVNILREFRNREEWKYQLFEEKFVHHWVNFCLENKFAERTAHGLIMSEKLALIYMTLLAKEVAKGRGASPITDVRKLDQYAIHTDTWNVSNNWKVELAKGIIDLQVPKLERISFDQLIHFRNKNRNLLTEFNAQLENVFNGVSNGVTPESFVDDNKRINAELAREFLNFGTGLTTISLGAWILIENVSAILPEYIEHIAATIGFGLTSGLGFNAAYKKQLPRRYCKKYLVQLKKL